MFKSLQCLFECSYSSCCGGRGKKTTKTAHVQQNKRSSISAQEQNQIIKHDATGGGGGGGAPAAAAVVVVIGANGNNQQQQQQLDINSRGESSVASGTVHNHYYDSQCPECGSISVYSEQEIICHPRPRARTPISCNKQQLLLSSP